MAEFRATVVKGTLDAIESLPDDPRAAVLRHIDAATLTTIRKASRTQHLPVAIHLQLDDAILRELGHDGLVQLYRGHTARYADSPLFGPILTGATALFGLGARSLLRGFATGYGLAGRDIGRVDYIGTPQGAQLRFRKVPHELRGPTLVGSNSGALLGILDLANQLGRVAAEQGELESGELTLIVTLTL